MEEKTLSVDCQVVRAKQRRIEENREKLRSIAKTVILCGRQNLALRGHRDDTTNMGDGNPGNFQALLAFRADGGDKALQDHLENAPKNATYRSKTTQNQLIEVIGKALQKQIADEVGEAGAFAVLADEATDSSNKKQRPLVVRYVHSDAEIQEAFVGFNECVDGVTGLDISTLVLRAVRELGLDMKKCFGQCYDGAGSMTGKVKGAAVRIQQEYPKAIYIQCAAHILNLCIVQSVEVQAICNMMGTMHELTNFFRFSRKRESLLLDKIEEVCPQSSHTKLKEICKTRWVQRLDSMEVMTELMDAVVETLEEIKVNAGKSWNHESTTKANGLYHSIMNFPFLMALTVTRKILAFTKGVTVKLQSRSTDMLKAYKDIKRVQEVIVKTRQGIDEYHHTCYEEASELARCHERNERYNCMCEARRKARSGKALLLFLVTCMHDAMHATCMLCAVWRTRDTVICGTE